MTVEEVGVMQTQVRDGKVPRSRKRQEQFLLQSFQKEAVCADAFTLVPKIHFRLLTSRTTGIPCFIVLHKYCVNVYKLNICDREGLPTWLSGKESTCQCRRSGFDPWVRKIPWSRKWQQTPVFLPRKFHGQRNYSPWSHKELDTTERLSTNIHKSISTIFSTALFLN